jgi:hypothetical protein
MNIESSEDETDVASPASQDDEGSTEAATDISDMEEEDLFALLRNELTQVDDEGELEDEAEDNEEGRYDLSRTAAHEYLGHGEHISRYAWVPALSLNTDAPHVRTDSVAHPSYEKASVLAAQ